MLGPWARGQGIGAAVLREVELQVGSRRLFLAVLEANARARAFWRREGFVDTG